MEKTAKRILSSLLALAMLLSFIIVFAIPATAVDGMWNVLGTATEYGEDFDGVPVSRPGYEYIPDVGLHMIPAKWEGQTPFGTFQTKEKVDLKSGVYMLVRIDNFTYAGEKWFNFSIWDSVGIAPGSKDHGEGAQCHIRPGDKKNVGGVDWYTEGFNNRGQTVIPKTAYSMDEEGRVILALTLTWDGESYAVDVNGAPAPDAVIEYMNEKWGGTDCEAHIGFSLQNSNKNGTVEATILKFGTSAETATVPMGDDRRDPEEFDHSHAEIMDGSTIPAGKPSVFMNGSVVDSDIMTKPVSLVGATLGINEDYSVHVAVNKSTAEAGQWTVKYDVSYSIEDFPICMILTRNLCTCRDEVCYANETCHLYLCTGDDIQPAPENKVEFLDVLKPDYDGDDKYLSFYIDMADEFAPFEATGRINSARVDFADIDYQTPGMNEFDVCWIAFFRSVEEAQQYVNEYLGIKNTDTPDDTVDPDNNETEPGQAIDTEEKNDQTQYESDSKQENVSDNAANADSGCASSVGFGTVAIVIAAIPPCIFYFKKKEDQSK